jgi:oxygen-independent coproporphyrinogen-3 oxidase
MSGIYLHIPFCKQACTYCDFHFSTSLKRKDEMLSAMKRELELRRNEVSSPVKTIYFGGGTPSLLRPREAGDLLSKIRDLFRVEKNAEITLEVNPDDLEGSLIREWADLGINRLSMGIQSFDESDLKFMNRAHDRGQAIAALEEACRHFDNLSIDLIYGIPGRSRKDWKRNLETAFEFPIQHISSYALTVEPRTALAHQIRTGKCESPSEEEALAHFEMLMEEASRQGFLHYEVSNFAREGYLSRHNTSYWQGETYLGIGPSAHSFSGDERSWNVSNNVKYIRALKQGNLDREQEMLGTGEKLNELIMTRLRTMWGLSLEQIEREFGAKEKARILDRAGRFIDRGLLHLSEDHLVADRSGFFLIDGIASDLFTD